MQLRLDPQICLPEDGLRGALAARVWLPGESGPAVAAVRPEGVFDISRAAPTMAHLLAAAEPVVLLRKAEGPCIGAAEDILVNSAAPSRDVARPFFLAPADLQPVMASGVTFVASLLERVIEERAAGDKTRAAGLRSTLSAEMGTALDGIVPGTPAAARLKAVLSARDLWSQYLEVGFGPDAELFSKCPPLAAVGPGAVIGIDPRSAWNNPEPEIVLAIGPDGRVKGAMLGNDVNLRDFEGRSALLLGRAKDFNASCALGPFLRLFDDGFGLDDLRQANILLGIVGEDGFRLDAEGSMEEISRDPVELAAQAFACHYYPDGVMLFCGTMIAPVTDRGPQGEGFTHKPGDAVTIRSGRLGGLVNQVAAADTVPPWRFGLAALMQNLAGRGLL